MPKNFVVCGLATGYYRGAMNPPDAPPPGEGQNPPPQSKSKMPASLRFMLDIPDLRAMDPDEAMAWQLDYLAKLKKEREALRAIGINPEEHIAGLEAHIAELAKADAKVAEKEDNLLHARADLGDAMFTLFKDMQALLAARRETHPFDPATEELAEYVEQWKEQFPKE